MRARDPLLLRVEALVGVLRQPRHRVPHAAGALVGGQAQLASVAALPELQQRGRQQRERSRLVGRVREQRVDELGLDLQAGALGGQLDRSAELVAPHRADEQLVVAEQRRQLGVLGAAAVEVGAHGEHDGRVAAPSSRRPGHR